MCRNVKTQESIIAEQKRYDALVLGVYDTRDDVDDLIGILAISAGFAKLYEVHNDGSKTLFATRGNVSSRPSNRTIGQWFDMPTCCRVA